MAKAHNFEIIYQKLKEMKSSQEDVQPFVAGEKEASVNEIDEIAELRRIVLEINEPDPHTYTSS